MITTIKKIYYRYIAKGDKQIKFFYNQLFENKFKSIDVLNSWRKHSNLIFDPLFYGCILHQAMFRNNSSLAIFILDSQEQIELPNYEIPKDKIHLAKLFDTVFQNIINNDFPTWMALLSSQSAYNILGLEKKYDLNENKSLIESFFNNKCISNYYRDKKRQTLILATCHIESVPLFKKIFLDMELLTKDKAKKIVKI